jgi:hypothetical protein
MSTARERQLEHLLRQLMNARPLRLYGEHWIERIREVLDGTEDMPPPAKPSPIRPIKRSEQ